MKKKGFTLVELVITIAIVIILSVVSVPIYRNYTEKAKLSEAYALQGALLSAQKAYYSEYGNFLKYNDVVWTSYDTVLGIDARGNKYFTCFRLWVGADPKYYFGIGIKIPEGIGKSYLHYQYNLTSGPSSWEGDDL